MENWVFLKDSQLVTLSFFEKEDYLLYDYTDSTGTGSYIYTDSVLVDTNDYYYDVGWGDQFYVYEDSTEIYAYTDSTESPAEEFFRHSIRPKFNIKFLMRISFSITDFIINHV